MSKRIALCRFPFRFRLFPEVDRALFNDLRILNVCRRLMYGVMLESRAGNEGFTAMTAEPQHYD
ncbi:MAG: hypothetical protein J4N97_11100, partial [Chloroflexi bacterium]|nr:hypothetical protein [Chloroflexota bacterium]